MNGVYTLVVAGKIKRGRENDYDRWVGKLVTALHDTPAYDGMTAISSPDPQSSVGTLLIRFCSAEALSEWEDSSVRHGLIGEGDRNNGWAFHFYIRPSRWKEPAWRFSPSGPSSQSRLHCGIGGHGHETVLSVHPVGL